ncbi:hypothetical protein [Arthrobacter sp. E3]|uniref:hypothetical protein n=1 Tax=Arthrobacter sp. E3 TaxID=517402 RepID=UPI001A94C3B3|nr:hypothetical protein [Arthrobacter sp. E3]
MVIFAIDDYAMSVEIVDPKKIVLSGWTLGGYLAPPGGVADCGHSFRRQPSSR